jgi:uncharacterized repeat protein (TIGR03803 family)
MKRLFLFVTQFALAAALHATQASAATETTLYSFHPTLHGQFPAGGLISDAAGNLYGVTTYGGFYDNGAVFMLSANSHGSWTETVLYSFKGRVGGASDGINPTGALTLDSSGNLYGATVGGGTSSDDAGTIFKLSQRNNKWVETILWNFQQLGSNDGFNPEGGLVFDKAGNLYGTTVNGGGATPNGCGTFGGCGAVFRLSPKGNGQWAEKVIYAFQGFSDGANPNDSLAIDSAGNVYGTTYAGNGVAFRVAPNSDGSWTETTLYSFSGGADGGAPFGGLIFDQGGNLDGVTSRGGTGTGCYGFPCGTIFQLTPGLNGQWSEKVLFSFNLDDGQAPSGKLLLDRAGNLYGTTVYGGSSSGGSKGVVFELTPGGNGQWNASVLWNFTGGSDGGNPEFGVIAVAGKLYGAVADSLVYGQNGNGVIFELTPSQGKWNETTIENFAYADGGRPQAALVADAAGNLYGVSSEAGSHGFGSVFKLTNSASGWKEQTLYNFPTGAPTGTYSYSNPSTLIFDADGNLYGETETGGSAEYGMIFELSPTSGGQWTEKTLFNFTRLATGLFPLGGLAFDSAGNLYGTTSEGGLVRHGCNFGCGTVFMLTPQPGSWSETVLYNFAGGSDGVAPLGGVVFDQAGNLYGTTSIGSVGSFCPSGCGTVFKLTPNSGGAWSETLLHSFTGMQGDGGLPPAGLIFDQAGNLYGTTFRGGSNTRDCGNFGCGTVFELSPQSGAWSETILYSFRGSDALYPDAGLVFDVAGNLYGTTVGGSYSDYGNVFELSPTSGGGWSESLLYSFQPPGSGDGNSPVASLIIGPSGALYGTAVDEGDGGWGTVFQITP